MKKSVVFLALITAASMLFGCNAKPEGEASVQSVSMICGIGSTVLVDRFAGVVSPRSETEITKDEEQLVSEIKVKAGDKVKKKQVLFTYDMEQTEMNLEKAELELTQLENELASQKSAKASLEKERNAASKDQKLSYTLQIQETDMAIMEANYNISSKEKEIEKLEKTLKNLKVKSPIKGQVKSINEDGATDNYGNPLPFMTLVESGSYRVKGYVNENNASALSEGTAVVLRSRVDDTTWNGTIASIDWKNPEESNNDSGASDSTTTSSKYPFYVDLESDEGLLLGQHVYIEPDYGQAAEEEEENQIQLPSVYLNDVDSTAWVWAQDDKGLLEKRNVTLGEYNEEMDTYPVESGLTAEDYIAFPDETLQEGMTCVEYDESMFENGGENGDMENGAMDGEGAMDENGMDGEGAMNENGMDGEGVMDENGMDGEGAMDENGMDGGAGEEAGADQNPGDESVNNGEAVE